MTEVGVDDMAMEVDARQLYDDLSDIKEMLAQMQTTLGRLAEATESRVYTEHPHVVQIEGVCGGRPIVDGTRISVRTIAERMHLGHSPEQIAKDYAFLTLAQVYDALSYYYEHKAEIEAEMVANKEALAWVTERSNG